MFSGRISNGEAALLQDPLGFGISPDLVSLGPEILPKVHLILINDKKRKGLPCSVPLNNRKIPTSRCSDLVVRRIVLYHTGTAQVEKYTSSCEYLD